MKDITTRQFVDDQLLSIITAWSDAYDRMAESALHIPQHAFEWEDEDEDEDDYTCPELVTTRQYEDLQATFLRMARDLISKAQDIGLISLDEWRTINHILWYAGSDEPIEEDWA